MPSSEHVVPITPIHEAYLEAFSLMLTADTLATQRRAKRVMEGTLPFVLAQSGCEHLLDRRSARGPTPRDKALERILHLVVLHLDLCEEE